MAAKKNASKKPAAKKGAPGKKAAPARKSAPKAEGGASDMKARFREALDKKNASKHASAEGAEHDGSEKSHGATGPTMAPEFRRKSI